MTDFTAIPCPACQNENWPAHWVCEDCSGTGKLVVRSSTVNILSWWPVVVGSAKVILTGVAGYGALYLIFKWFGSH